MNYLNRKLKYIVQMTMETVQWQCKQKPKEQINIIRTDHYSIVCLLILISIRQIHQQTSKSIRDSFYTWKCIWWIVLPRHRLNQQRKPSNGNDVVTKLYVHIQYSCTSCVCKVFGNVFAERFHRMVNRRGAKWSKCRMP